MKRVFMSLILGGILTLAALLLVPGGGGVGTAFSADGACSVTVTHNCIRQLAAEDAQAIPYEQQVIATATALGSVKYCAAQQNKTEPEFVDKAYKAFNRLFSSGDKPELSTMSFRGYLKSVNVGAMLVPDPGSGERFETFGDGLYRLLDMDIPGSCDFAEVYVRKALEAGGVLADPT